MHVSKDSLEPGSPPRCSLCGTSPLWSPPELPSRLRSCSQRRSAGRRRESAALVLDLGFEPFRGQGAAPRRAVTLSKRADAERIFAGTTLSGPRSGWRFHGGGHGTRLGVSPRSIRATARVAALGFARFFVGRATRRLGFRDAARVYPDSPSAGYRDRPAPTSRGVAALVRPAARHDPHCAFGPATDRTLDRRARALDVQAKRLYGLAAAPRSPALFQRSTTRPSCSSLVTERERPAAVVRFARRVRRAFSQLGPLTRRFGAQSVRSPRPCSWLARAHRFGSRGKTQLLRAQRAGQRRPRQEAKRLLTVLRSDTASRG